MIFICAYTTPEGHPFTVHIAAANELNARLVWEHRHPAKYGYALMQISVAEPGAVAHMHWEEYASEFSEGLSSRLVKGTDMGLIMLTILGYIVTVSGGTAIGLYIAHSCNHAESMPMGVCGLGFGIACGYAINVMLDWMRSIMLLQQAIIAHQARANPAFTRQDPV